MKITTEEDLDRNFWQAVRGICILGVVLIHALGGYDYSSSSETYFILLRKLINFSVTTFIFMSGYFVNVNQIISENFNYKAWLSVRAQRLLIPFILWSGFYSLISILRIINAGDTINWKSLVFQFAIGKSAAPFYYILVLFQLTLISPWLVRVIEKKGKLERMLWLVTPIYLFYLYLWNFRIGGQPFLYETLFPAWFGFYYLGLQVKSGMKMKKSNYSWLILTFLFSSIEAFGLRQLNVSFYTSQITVGSFLYSLAVIGLILNMAESQSVKKQEKAEKTIFSRLGDCSYGIFYIHMLVLMIVSKSIEALEITENWFLYFGTRFIFTVFISYTIVKTTQLLLKNHKKQLLWIGFK